jgi:TRAP-type C4-dicarboxylate transport system permease small subunit
MLEGMIRWTVIVLAIIMVAAIGSQVIARYVFSQSLYWTEELGRHVMIWMVFLACVLCLRKGFHLNITSVEERLSPENRAILHIIAAVVLAFFFYWMTVHGWTLVQKTMVQRSSAMHYPMGYVYAALPVSGLLMFVVNIELIVKSGRELLKIRKSKRNSSSLCQEGN